MFKTQLKTKKQYEKNKFDKKILIITKKTNQLSIFDKDSNVFIINSAQ